MARDAAGGMRRDGAPRFEADDAPAFSSPLADDAGDVASAEALDALSRRLDPEARKDYQSSVRLAKALVEYQTRKDAIIAASDLLERHRDEYVRLEGDFNALRTRSEALFAEPPFTPFRFTADELQRAFEAVGFLPPDWEKEDSGRKPPAGDSLHHLAPARQPDRVADRETLTPPPRPFAFPRTQCPPTRFAGCMWDGSARSSETSTAPRAIGRGRSGEGRMSALMGHPVSLYQKFFIETLFRVACGYWLVKALQGAALRVHLISTPASP
jgi:hypothetical protein